MELGDAEKKGKKSLFSGKMRQIGYYRKNERKKLILSWKIVVLHKRERKNWVVLYRKTGNIYCFHGTFVEILILGNQGT